MEFMINTTYENVWENSEVIKKGEKYWKKLFVELGENWGWNLKM